MLPATSGRPGSRSFTADWHLVLLLLAASWLTACSSGGASGSGGVPGTGGAAATGGGAGAAATTGSGGTTGDPNAIVGSFNVSLVEAMGATAAQTKIIGVVRDGPQPEAVTFIKGTTDGGCALYTPHIPFCSTPCGGSAACVADDTCQAYPAAKDVGTVTVGGVANSTGAATFPLTLVGGNYSAVGVVPSYPPFAEGADVSVTASGGVYGPFSLHAKGVAPLVLGADTFTLQRGQPLVVTWTAAGAAGDSTIQVKLDISHHGGTKGQILCQTADSGSLTIGASLVTMLVDLGISGYPSIIVTRSAVGSAAIAPGRVRLLLSEDVERYIQIPGLMSCQSDADCPTGKTCQEDLQCK